MKGRVGRHQSNLLKFIINNSNKRNLQLRDINDLFTPASVDDTNRESEHGILWSSIVENGGSEKFTTSNKKNSKNHKENVPVPATGQLNKNFS